MGRIDTKRMNTLILMFQFSRQKCTIFEISAEGPVSQVYDQLSVLQLNSTGLPNPLWGFFFLEELLEKEELRTSKKFQTGNCRCL